MDNGLSAFHVGEFLHHHGRDGLAPMPFVSGKQTVWNGLCDCHAHPGLHPAHLSQSTQILDQYFNPPYKPRHLKES